MAAVAIGAVIPAETGNHPEYFACQPELFVQLLSAGPSLGTELDPEFRRTRQLLVAWLIQRNLSRIDFRQGAASDLKEGKSRSRIARLIVDGIERGEVYCWIHDNRRQVIRRRVIVTQNAILVKGDESTLYVAGTPFLTKYTCTLGDWKLLDHFVS